MRTQPQRLAGFSLVEIMIAMVIALLGTIIIFQVFSVSEGIKRTTTSGGDAQQNGLLALVTIERNARMAGYGINFAQLLNCTVLAHDEGPPVRNYTFPLLPAQIGVGAANAPVSISFVFGNSNNVLAPAKLTASSAALDTMFKIDNRFGFNNGDLIIAAEVGAAKNCTMRQVTDLPAAATDTVTNASGSYTNASGNSVPARFNNAGGIGIAYNSWDNTAQSGGRLYDVGPAPSILTYSVQNGQLVMQNFLTSTVGSPIADGIVQLQAMYGWDSIGDGIVHTWTSTMPATATATDWSRVLALRIGLVARSSLMERPNATTGLCDTTTVQPTWTGGTMTISTDPNWMCYRYRVFETTVPLRNVIWAQVS